jgi:anti-sigma regulatory factor (Ser/Thr protein kinase)
VLPPGPQDTVAVRFEPKPEAATYAREALRAAFASRLPTNVFADLLIIVTELVNNAVEHGPKLAVDLKVTLDGEMIRGEVRDQGDPARSFPRVREATDGAAGGRGLMLVEALTSEWWIQEGSTTVVFELPAAD